MLRRRPARSLALVATACLVVATGCGDGKGSGAGSLAPEEASPASTDGPSLADAPTTIPEAPATTATTATAAPATSAPAVLPPRPDWLGKRPLPLRSDGFGEIQPTPPELRDRRLPTVDVLPPPPNGAFVATVAEVPPDVAARSTWQQACPVALSDLRYVQVTFWGFDERPHTGELLVHRTAAEPLVEVFRRLHDARFPIEEMRVTRADELDAHPTGDGNNTGAFVCRPSRGTRTWSEHAKGLAIDINPFHNPYTRRDVVLPELASAYTDRDDVRPGMIVAGDAVTQAFAAIGWGWGGAWDSPKDPMHFSSSGR